MCEWKFSSAKYSYIMLRINRLWSITWSFTCITLYRQSNCLRKLLCPNRWDKVTFKFLCNFKFNLIKVSAFRFACDCLNALCFQPRFGPHYVIQTNMGMVVDYKFWSRLSRTVSMKTKTLLWLIFPCLLPAKYINIPLGRKKAFQHSCLYLSRVGSQIWWGLTITR